MTFPTYTIEIADEQDRMICDQQRLRQVVESTLADERIASAEISLALVDDPTIHEVNRNHLDHDYATDVLSFLLCDAPVEGEAGDRHVEGEVVVSTETAVRQAEEFGWDADAELTLYVVHGLLHLCGYDDQTAEDRSKMRARERDVLKKWGITPHYEDEPVAPGGQAGI
ncbi:Endoribonuclease YbeY [Maioricimonas rarisocia]|uniref:Endoribonuclease YbeY n=1 Tax=Maioricimonas rarisocia TaxID=2528026 RepID=A0A517Z7P5_9PLAN|nr:rRNA maturation RNase YbeY [Maioricimonas rarisocia]QDU38479.1 Endoribonuclease YbeY [Maioricimonas rarisocia]